MYSCCNGTRFARKHTRSLIASGGTLFLFNVLHIFVTSPVCMPRASTHACYLDAPCDPKNRNRKAININKTICQLYQQATPICNEHTEHSKTGRSSNLLICFKLESIKLESMPDIWGQGPLCSDQYQTTTICCPFLAC